MTVSYPGDPVIGLVGEGFGSLLVFCTARRLGLENREITILATNESPFLAPDRPDAVLSPGAARIG
jgi:hypothetical protein